jgi:hypothetical protein
MKGKIKVNTMFQISADNLNYIYKASDNLIRVTITDADDAAITTALVTAELNDPGGTLVTNSGISLTHDAEGVYEGWMPDSLSLTEGAVYTLEIMAEDDDKIAVWKQDLTCRYAAISGGAYGA